jgi:hypothetical protein
MTYTPVTWDENTYITATKFNHLETQYDTLMSDYVSGHNHDTLYYTKSISDTTFYWSTYMGHGSGANGDTLNTHHASELLGVSLPVGTIIMWDGLVTSIPTGWHICDGTKIGDETTANLTNNFIAGAGTTYSLGQSFGYAAVVPTGTVTVDGHSLTEAELPTHKHTYTDQWNYESDESNATGGNGYTYEHLVIDDYTTHSTTSDGGKLPTGTAADAHGHTGSLSSYSSESNLPPYYALYYIQRVY